MDLGLDGFMVAWTPRHVAARDGDERFVPGTIEVGPRPDTTGWSDHFLMGWSLADDRAVTTVRKVAMLFICFHTIVVRDGISAEAAHREFLKVDEYRRRIAPDTPGADPEGALGAVDH